MKIINKRRLTISSIIIAVVINCLLPILLYNWLKHIMPILPALIIATLIPLLDNFIYMIKYKMFDVFGLLMLGSIVLSISLASLGGSERLVLMRDSFVTVAIGACFIFSLFMRRPLIYHLSKRFLMHLNADQLEHNWGIPSYRFGFRLITFVWGIALLLEAAARIFLIYELSVETFLVLSKFMLYGTIGCTAVWTIGYRRYLVKKNEHYIK